MASVIYNGCSLIPGPLVEFVDESILAGNQQRLGTTYRITINGTIVMWKGSPAANPGTGASWGGFNNQFWVDTGYPPDEVSPNVNTLRQLYMIESKQEALRNLFSTEGLWLEFQSQDGSAPLKCQPKNIVITFAQGTWFQTCPYTITAECDALYLNGQILNANAVSDLIQNAGETWQIQPSETVKTFSVSHTVSAVGKRVFNQVGQEVETAWQRAKDFVNTKLVLGWYGSSSFSPISGDQIFKQSSLGSGVLNFTTYKNYNFSRTEDIDELAGSYSCTETWILSNIPSGSHVYTTSNKRIVDDPYCTIVSNIQGTINGFYDGLFNYDQRLKAAEYVLSSFGGPTGLLQFIPISTGYVYNNQPRQGALDYDYNNGTISYQYEFSNQLFENDAFEQWTLSKKKSVNDYITTFDIAGTIKGRRYDGDTDVMVSFARANEQWMTISGNNFSTLYNRILSSKYFPEASGMNIQTYPVSASVDMNEAEGLITYSFEWNNRQNDYDLPSNNVKEEFQITKHFSVDEGVSVYTINGTVEGLNITDFNSRFAKYAAASGYFYTYVLPNVYNRVKDYYQVDLPNTNPLVTEITQLPIIGNIQYSFEFRNTPLPLLPGVLSEHIVISENNYSERVNVIGKIPVVGKPHGPVIQDMKTSTEKTRSVSVEAVLTPSTGATLLDLFNQKPNYDQYILPLQPAGSYCTNWVDNWDAKGSRYGVNVEWTYI